LERALIEVRAICELEFLLASEVHQGYWEKEKNKSTTYSTRIGNENLRLFEEQHYGDDWK